MFLHPTQMKNGSSCFTYLFITNTTAFFHRVDFVDSLGRKRRCLKKDLAYYQQQDEELYNAKPKESSASYGNFVKASEESAENEVLSLDEEARKYQRLKWEEEEAANAVKSNIHYQDILYQGIFFNQILTLTPTLRIGIVRQDKLVVK